MAEIIRMPKMSDTMEEGVIASWLKKVGDEIKSGDILAEVETDKATMELESYDDGVLLHIGVKDGDSVPVDGVIAIIGEKGEDVDEILKDIENDTSSVDNSEEVNETPIEKEKINPSLYWAFEMAEFYGIDFQRVGEYYSGRKRNDSRKDQGEGEVSSQAEDESQTL